MEKYNEKQLNCRNKEHYPPRFRYLQPGQYKHTCPGCGKVVEINIPKVEHGK